MDVLTASNENSALISTINSAEQSQILPFNYALEKNIPAHGFQIVSHSTVTGSIGKSKAHDFDINKYGYLRSLTLQCKFTGHATATAKSTIMGGLGFIESIELLSSGRRLQYLSRDAYLCALSDLPRDTRKGIEQSLFMDAVGNFAGATEKVFHIPILMSLFDNVRNTINARFNEALRLRVTTSAGAHLKAAGSATPGSFALDDMTLLAEYRRLPMPLDDKVVQEDFGDNQPLTKVIYDYSEETTVPVTLKDDAIVSTSVEIKDNGAVDAIFVIVKADLITAANNSDAVQLATDKPLECANIKFSASGQTILDVPGRYLEYLGKRTLGGGFYGTSPGKAGGTTEAANLCYVYKIQMGLDHSSQYFSNLASLRELNTPTITVDIAKQSSNLDDKAGTVKVIVRKAMLMTTDAASGKNSIGVSN